MKKHTQSARYTVTPVAIRYPLAPISGRASLPTSEKSIEHVQGAAYSADTLADMLKRTGRLVRAAKKIFDSDGARAFLRFLDMHPILVCHQDIRDIYLRLRRAGRTSRGQGRPGNIFANTPLSVAWLVQELKVRDQVKNDEQAYVWLEAHEGIAYETARGLCNQARTEDRFKALLIMDDSQVRPATSQENEMARNAKRLEVGKPQHLTVNHPSLGRIGISIEAVDKKKIRDNRK